MGYRNDLLGGLKAIHDLARWRHKVHMEAWRSSGLEAPAGIELWRARIDAAKAAGATRFLKLEAGL